MKKYNSLGKVYGTSNWKENISLNSTKKTNSFDLVECSCGLSFSKNANRCPSCNKINNRYPHETFRCRICDELLLKEENYPTVGLRTIKNGSDCVSYSKSHRRCPKCGEPEPYPIEKRMYEPLNMLKIACIVIFIFLILNVLGKYHN